MSTDTVLQLAFTPVAPAPIAGHAVRVDTAPPGVPGAVPGAPIAGHAVRGNPAGADNGEIVIQGENGRFYIIQTTPEQAARRNQLHNQILQAVQTAPGFAPPPGINWNDVTINMTDGSLEYNGQILYRIRDNNNQQLSRLLLDLRMVFHDAMRQRFSDSIWRTYSTNDRSHRQASLPFAPLIQGSQLKNIHFTDADLTVAVRGKAPAIEQRIRRRSVLIDVLKGIIPNIIRGQSRAVTAQRLDTASRKQLLAKLKEDFSQTNDLALGFAGAYPLDLRPLPDSQAKIQALTAQKGRAKDFLVRACNRDKSFYQFGPENEEHLEELSKQLALLSCETEADYELGCMHFNTKPTLTTPDFFIMQLAEVVRSSPEATLRQNVTAYIDGHFQLYFSTITHPEDREAIRQQLIEQSIQFRIRIPGAPGFEGDYTTP